MVQIPKPVVEHSRFTRHRVHNKSALPLPGSNSILKESSSVTRLNALVESDSVRSIEKFKRSTSTAQIAKKVNRDYIGNLAKKAVPGSRPTLKAGLSSRAVFEKKTHDLSQLSDQETQELEHKYPFETRLQLSSENNNLSAFRLFIKRPRQFEDP